MVSSMRVTSSSPTSTRSGWAEVTRVFSGMVDIGYHLLAFQKDLHTALYCHRGVPGCPLPKLRGHYHAAKCTFLAVMLSSLRGCGE